MNTITDKGKLTPGETFTTTLQPLMSEEVSDLKPLELKYQQYQTYMWFYDHSKRVYIYILPILYDIVLTIFVLKDGASPIIEVGVIMQVTLSVLMLASFFFVIESKIHIDNTINIEYVDKKEKKDKIINELASKDVLVLSGT